jgi:hypothetical protein
MKIGWLRPRHWRWIKRAAPAADWFVSKQFLAACLVPSLWSRSRYAALMQRLKSNTVNFSLIQHAVRPINILVRVFVLHLFDGCRFAG